MLFFVSNYIYYYYYYVGKNYTCSLEALSLFHLFTNVVILCNNFQCVYTILRHYIDEDKASSSYVIGVTNVRDKETTGEMRAYSCCKGPHKVRYPLQRLYCLSTLPVAGAVHSVGEIRTYIASEIT